MVRLVFRPYTQIRRTICTSVSLRASTRVSPGFALSRHSSPSFGSQQICSYSNLPQVDDRSMVHPRPKAKGIPPQPPKGGLHFHYASGFLHPNTRIYVRLLGPCFKTGRWKTIASKSPLHKTPHEPMPTQTTRHNFVIPHRCTEQRTYGAAQKGMQKAYLNPTDSDTQRI
jgi:hypothetical protein